MLLATGKTRFLEVTFNFCTYVAATKLENKDRFVLAELHPTRSTSSLETGEKYAIRLKKNCKFVSYLCLALGK